MWQDVTPIDLEGASETIVTLNNIDPKIATAALRWDLPTVRSLARKLSSSEAEHVESLVPQLFAIAILGHVLQFARTLANQLHTPTGFPALDRADYDRSRRTLKVGTVYNHFFNDLKLADLVKSSYTPSPELGGACGFKDAPRLNGDTAEQLRSTGLFARAKRELQALRKAHGRELEVILDQSVEQLSSLRDRQFRIIEHLKASYDDNKIFGNIGRTSPTVLLFIVIEQTFLFLVEPPAGRTWPPEEAARCSARSAAGYPMSLLGGYSPTPEQRPMIDNLFAAYRFAVLGDDEAIPVANRKSTRRNYVASRIHNAKRHSSRGEAPAPFRAIMKKFQSNMDGSKEIDTVAKREASRLKDRLVDIPADANSAFRFVDKVISLYI